MDDPDDLYREFNAEAEAYQQEVKRIEQERRVTSLLQMLEAVAGEDGSAADDDWMESIDPLYSLTIVDRANVGTHQRWAAFEDRHPKLKSIPASERAELAKQAYPGESWSELLYRLGYSKQGRSKS
ncbi:hypothetical protein [Pseudomonas sp. W5-01]|uniref:hypothetical protein n=1 Tax=Pseudomonas sp. W5-01 TaxID=3097454 RepID=UPI00397D9FDC